MRKARERMVRDQPVCALDGCSSRRLTTTLSASPSRREVEVAGVADRPVSNLHHVPESLRRIQRWLSAAPRARRFVSAAHGGPIVPDRRMFKMQSPG